jgi:hypothetical protein
LFNGEKKLRIGFDFGERWRSKDQVRMLSTKSGFNICEQACSRTIQTSGADLFSAERITVDAREKG